MVVAIWLVLVPAVASSAEWAPDPPTIDQDGTHRPFRERLAGEVTILHFMYPSCTSFCPVSGEVLSQTQDALARRPPAKPFRILSVSIVPREATPSRLTGWLRQHRARVGWTALHVGPGDLGPLLRFYGETLVDVQLHSSQMLVLDRQGRISRRFDDIPTPAMLAAAVRIAAR